MILTPTGVGTKSTGHKEEEEDKNGHLCIILFDHHQVWCLLWHQPTTTAETAHLAPRGAKNEQAFSGVNLKWERTSGALYAHSGPTFFILEHKKEALSRLRPLFAYSGPTFFSFSTNK